MFFPVLGSGVAAQYPLKRATAHHLVETVSPGGYIMRSRGESAPVKRWALKYEELSDAEVQSILTLYEACAGGWAAFTFIDPLANLFTWSEDLNAVQWEKAAGVSVSRQVDAGSGLAEHGIANGSQAVGGVGQRMELPAGCVCCLSCELKGAGSGTAWIEAAGARRAVAVTGEWAQVWVSGESGGGVVSFSVELPAGGAVQVRRMQAEAQAAPSAYQASYERGAVYTKTRFADGQVVVVSTGPGRNSVEVALESREENPA